MMQWLTFSMNSDGKRMAEMKCKSCCEFRNCYATTAEHSLMGQRLSTVVDHAMHACVNV